MEMSSNKVKLRKNIVKYLNSLEMFDEVITEYKLFGHYNNLRLSDTGNAIIKKVFKSYEFIIDTDISIKDKVSISKNMNSPFYLTDKKIYIYDEDEAAYINLIGDIRIWIESIKL